MPGKRLAGGLAAAVVTTLAFGATAWATGPHNSLVIKGPLAAAQGASYTITTSGYAKHVVGKPHPNYVVGWRTPTACATDYTSELTAVGSSVTPDLAKSVRGNFTEANPFTA